MQQFLQASGATENQLEQIATELAELIQTRPDLPLRAYTHNYETPTEIEVGLGYTCSTDFYDNGIIPLIEQALKTVDYDTKPNQNDSTISRWLFDGARQIGVRLQIPHDKPEEVIKIFKSLNQILKDVTTCQPPNPISFVM